MLSLIIIYERNAMDPGKRFINNTLLSLLCFNSIVKNVIFSNFLTYQLIFGTPGSLSKFSKLSYKEVKLKFTKSNISTDHEINIFGMYYGGILTYTNGAMILGEMGIIQLLYVTHFSKMITLDDSFILMILNQFNLLIVFGTTIIRVYIEEPFLNIHYQTMNLLNEPMVTSEFSRELEPYFKVIAIW